MGVCLKPVGITDSVRDMLKISVNTPARILLRPILYTDWCAITNQSCSIPIYKQTIVIYGSMPFTLNWTVLTA